MVLCNANSLFLVRTLLPLLTKLVILRIYNCWFTISKIQQYIMTKKCNTQASIYSQRLNRILDTLGTTR